MRNGTQRIRQTVALATAIAALAAPAAWAAPAEQILSENAGSTTGNAQEQSYSSLNSVAPYAPQSTPSPAPTSTPGDGFDWGDAGIGATVVLALGAMVAGGAVVLRTRPQRGTVA
jgi:hypothetical protein